MHKNTILQAQSYDASPITCLGIHLPAKQILLSGIHLPIKKPLHFVDLSLHKELHFQISTTPQRIAFSYFYYTQWVLLKTIKGVREETRIWRSSIAVLLYFEPFQLALPAIVIPLPLLPTIQSTNTVADIMLPKRLSQLRINRSSWSIQVCRRIFCGWDVSR